MVDSVLSGYLAVSQSVAFSGTRTLVSLASEEFTDLSDVIDNSLTGYMFSEWAFACTSVVFTGESFELYIIPLVDAAYPTWTGDGIVDEPQNAPHFVGSFALTGATGAQEATLRSIALPSGLFKVGCRNRGGVALAASGTTLKWRPWGYKSR